MFVPDSLRQFARLFPVPLYLVGGYVRDGLDGIVSDDFDICSSLTPEEVKNLLDGKYVLDLIKKDTGTVSVRYGKQIWQYTMFRTDIYGQGHTPLSAVKASMEEDARRRDFKANAIYYDIQNDTFCDLLGGIEDVKNKVLSPTRPPQEVFSEDGLRLMRLARISAETGYTPEESTLLSARENAFRIREIAPERIRVELEKILHADEKRGITGATSKGIDLLRKIGVLEIILPELTKGIGMTQRSDFHKYDVYGHTLCTLENAPSSIRTVALLHDIGKPYAMEKTGKYRNHELYGAEIAEEIMNRLRYSAKEIARNKRLIRWHMLDKRNKEQENTIRRFVQKNADILDDLCALELADQYGGGYLRSDFCPSAERLRKAYSALVAEGIPFSVKDLLVGGKDFPPEDILPKNKRGEALNALLTLCADIDSPYLTYEQQKKFLYSYCKQ